MSRTRRNSSSNYFRDPHTQSTRITEHKALEDLDYNNFKVPNRLKYRSNKNCENLPNSFEDLHVAGYKEMDYNKGMFFKRNKYESYIKWR